MLQWQLGWQPATLIALCVAAVGLIARRFPGRRAAVFAAGLATETALVLVLFALWQLAGSLSLSQVTGAVGRGQSLWHLERVLLLPNEAWMQRQILPHREVLTFANNYYALMHAPPLAVFLVWLYAWHRDQYRPVRNTIVLLTGACLLIQLLPVAPPRLIPALGMTDTARVMGQSVYGAIGKGMTDQFSAMPSVHIGWAVLIALAVVRYGRNRWRWLVLLHPLVMAVVVVVTANHFWLDGAVSVALLATAIAAQRAARGIRPLAAPRTL